MTIASFTDGFWWSNDGLRLHYRDYAGRPDRPPILCIPGLTRNARDFERIAERLAPEWRVIAVELRGRGESAFAADPMSYAPLTYLQDIEALVRELGLERLVVFATSLGGIVAMLLARAEQGRIAGALLNDVSPELAPGGLDRIRNYVGRSLNFPTWMHAARHFQQAQRDVYPGWSIDDWLVFAKRLCRLNPQGRIVLDYDMRIAEPLKGPAPAGGFDLWTAFHGLKDVPSLLVRGERSDLVLPEVAERMAREAPLMEVVSVPGVGHAPTLEEPQAVAAIDRLLGRVAAGAG